jgi:glycosyltransferase involved in cell wall biosynthesis/GT2 family glycosyltransferase
VSDRRLLPPVALPDLVSVVVVAGADAAATEAALARIEGLERGGPRVETIVVVPPDAAAPPSAPARRAREVVRLEQWSGTGAARNAGAEAARGGRLAFLSVDARPGPRWLSAAVAALRTDSRAVGAASKVVAEDGTIEFAGAAMTFAGEPRALHAGEPAEAIEDHAGEALFAAEAAMIVDARAFRWVGGFDSELAPGVEFADLGWRLWLRGFRIRYVPESVVVGRAWPRPASEPDATRHAFGSLGMIYKNYDEARLGRILAAAVLQAGRSRAGAAAAERFTAAMPALVAAREAVQQQRVVGDAQLLPLFREPLAEAVSPSVEDVADAFGVQQEFARHRIAIVTPDVLRPQMAGPAIRAWQMAIALSQEHDVRLASTTTCELSHPDFPVSHVGVKEFKELEAWCDVLIFQGHVLDDYQWLRHSPKVLVVDIYDPFHLEVLEATRDLTDYARRNAVRIAAEVVNEQLVRGDYFLCASEKQRDFWLGQLAGVGRINAAVYDGNENLASLIAVVPFGASDAEPRHTRAVMKGVLPGIGTDDKVVLWGGGVYNWFDPLTLIRATDRLRHRIPEVRTYFMGMQHPNPKVPAMRMGYETQRLAEELGLVGKYVFFNEGWVDYEDRQNYLLESDVGVSLHLDRVETAFSFRTRILDYFWASLPVVATHGDSFADLIELHGLGVTVPPQDDAALEEALFVLLTDEERRAACRAAVSRCVEEFRWQRTLAPLLEFCRAPRRAPDLVDPRQRALIGDPLLHSWGAPTWRDTLGRVVDHARHGEYDELVRKLRGRARRLLFPDALGPGGWGDAEWPRG